jgi:hypothetical protein
MPDTYHSAGPRRVPPLSSSAKAGTSSRGEGADALTRGGAGTLGIFLKGLAVAGGKRAPAALYLQPPSGCSFTGRSRRRPRWRCGCGR